MENSKKSKPDPSGQNLNGIFEADPDGKLIVDKKGKVLLANPAAARIMDREPAGIIGHSFKYPLTTGRDSEIQLLKRDGSTGNAEMRAMATRWQGKDAFLVTLRDVTGHHWVEEELLNRNATLAAIFENAPNIVMLVNDEGRVVDINRAGIEFAGRKKEELLGLLGGEVFQCLNSFDGEGCGKNAECTDCPVRSRVERTLETGEPIYDEEGEFEIRRYGETVRLHLLISTSPIKTSEGRQVLVTLTDITNKYKIARALETSERHYHFLMDNVPSAVSIVQDGKIVFANRRVEKLTGYTFEELIDINGFDLVHPDDREKVRERYQKRSRGEAEVKAYSLRIIKKSGDTAWVRRRVSTLEWEGKAASLVMDVDITERMKAEEEARKRREELNLMLNQVPCILWSMDTDLRYTAASGSGLKTSGRIPEDLIGKTIYEYNRKFTESSHFVKVLRKALKGHSQTIEEQSVSNNRTFQVHMEPMYGDDGREIIGIVGVSVDVTQSKEAEQKTRENQQKYQTLFEGSGDAAFVHQPSQEGLPGKFIEVNEAACRLLGFTRNALLKMNPGEIVLWEKAGVTPAGIMQRLQREKRIILETAFRHKDGHEIPAEVHIHLFELEDKPTVLTLARDITERKKAEADLIERQIVLRKMLDESLEMVGSKSGAIDYAGLTDSMRDICGAKYGVFNLFDENGRDFTTMAVSGFSDDHHLIPATLGFKLKGKKWKYDPIRAGKTRDRTITRFESVHELSGAVLPKMAVQALEKAFGTGETFVVKISRHGVTVGDFTLFFANGDTLKNKELAELFANNIGLYIDRRTAEEELEQTKDQLSKAELFAGFGHWQINLAEKSVESSLGARGIYGAGDKELTLADIKKFPLPQYRKTLDKALDGLVKRNEPYDLEFKITRGSDGNIRDIHSTAEYDSGSNKVFGVIQDITKRKKAEEELQRYVNELKDRNNFIQTIIDNLPIGLAINSIGDGKATYINSKFEEIYGWPKKDITDISRFFEKVYPDPDYRKQIQERVMADIASGDPARMAWDNIEIITNPGRKR